MTKRKNKLALKIFSCAVFAALPSMLFAKTDITPGSKHGSNPIYPSYTGRVMAGYQGWFRAPGDPSGRGWVHWGAKGNFDDDSITVEALPEMHEYEHRYPSGFKFPDGKALEVFSSADYQTVDTHFKWMKEYGIDGAMMQRFFGTTNPEYRQDSVRVLKHAKEASAKHGRALVIMYDLSGARSGQDISERLIADWKYLVDELKVTSGENTNYLFHNGGPLVSIWGLGFIDRPYTLEDIGIEKFIRFLKEDKEYGGCSVMLGVPPTFRTLDGDTQNDPKLHELLKMSDVVSPWNTGRFRMNGTKESREALIKVLSNRVQKDVEFCNEIGIDYAPVIYPGFGWDNLMRIRNRLKNSNPIPRLKGDLYWTLAKTMIDNGTKMIYIAMFDEVDEATAIFKCRDDFPIAPKSNFVSFEGMGSDFYLYLSGEIRKALNGQIKMGDETPRRGK